MSTDRLQEWLAFVEQVRDASPLAEIVALDTKVDDNGFAVCPLHADRDPSFHLFGDNLEVFQCFGCGQNGDVFSYVQARDRCSFREAVDTLAERAGLRWETSPLDEDDDEFQDELARLNERRLVQLILTRAANYMHHALPRKIRRQVRETYGFDDDTIRRFLIGWGDPDGLLYYLTEELEYSIEDVLKTGLFVKFGDRIEGFFDRRIVFPYMKSGQVVYMIGRRTEYTGDEEFERGKYKKLPTHSAKFPYVSETISNEHFFGEDTARGSIPEIVITEGITDCMALVSIGRASISPVTVRFRKRDLPHSLELTRRIERVTICNDADELEDGSSPGLEGALATARALFKHGRDVRIAQLPRPPGVSKVDVCEFVRDAMLEAENQGHPNPKRYASEKIGDVFASAKSYPQFLIETIPTGLDPTELASRLKPIFEIVATCPPLEREGYVESIAARFRRSRQTVARSVAEFVSDDERRDQQDEREESKTNTSDDDERIKGKVYEDVAHYYTKGRYVDEVISSFVLVPHMLIEYEDGRFLVNADVRAKGLAHDIPHSFAWRAWSGKREFLREIHSIHPACQFMGNDDNVQGVLALLDPGGLPKRRGTLNLGLCETKRGPRWVTPTITIGADGLIEDDGNEVIFVEQKAALGQRLVYEFPEDDELRELASRVLPRLLDLNEPEIMLPMIGFFFAAPLRPLIFDRLSHFPILFVHGTQGTGKTSLLRDVFWPLLGVIKHRDPFSCTDTFFATISLLASTNSIPVMLDEYKPADMGKYRVEQVHRLLRRAYNGEVEMRGRADQTVTQYRLHAPIAVAGETRPENDPALTERTICVNPDKTSLTPERQQAFGEVATAPLQKIAGPLIQFLIAQDVDAVLAQARKVTDELLRRTGRLGKVPIRCYDSFQVMIAGLLLFESFAESLDVAISGVDYVTAFESVVRELLEGDGSAVKDAFDNVLEACSTYAHLGLLVDEKHYLQQDGRLFLHLPSVLKVYRDERRKAGEDDASGGIRALKKIAEEKFKAGSYIVSTDSRVLVGESRLRCVEIDQGKVPESLEFERFPANAPEKRSRGWQKDWQDGESDQDYGAN